MILDDGVGALAMVNVEKTPTQAIDCVPLLHLWRHTLTRRKTPRKGQCHNKACDDSHPFHSSIIFVNSLNR